MLENNDKPVLNYAMIYYNKPGILWIRLWKEVKFWSHNRLSKWNNKTEKSDSMKTNISTEQLKPSQLLIYNTLTSVWERLICYERKQW